MADLLRMAYELFVQYVKLARIATVPHQHIVLDTLLSQHVLETAARHQEMQSLYAA